MKNLLLTIVLASFGGALYACNACLVENEVQAVNPVGGYKNPSAGGNAAAAGAAAAAATVETHATRPSMDYEESE